MFMANVLKFNLSLSLCRSLPASNINVASVHRACSTSAWTKSRHSFRRVTLRYVTLRFWLSVSLVGRRVRQRTPNSCCHSRHDTRRRRRRRDALLLSCCGRVCALGNMLRQHVSQVTWPLATALAVVVVPCNQLIGKLSKARVFVCVCEWVLLCACVLVCLCVIYCKQS